MKVTNPQNDAQMSPQHRLIIGYALILCTIAVVTGFLVFTNTVRYPILIIGIILCMTSIVSPRVGIYSLFGVLPFIYFFKRLEFFVYFDPSSEYNNPVSLLPEFLVISLIASLVLRKVQRNEFTIPSDKFSIAVIIFFLATLAQVFNVRSSITTGLYGFRTFGFYILTYFIGFYYIHSHSIQRLLQWNTIIAVFSASYGIMQQLVQLPPWDRLWVIHLLPGSIYSWVLSMPFSFGGMRKWATLHSPPAAAHYFVFSIILAFILFKQSHYRFTKITISGAIVIISIAFLLTSTRGSLVALLVALTVMVLLDWLRKRLRSQSKILATLITSLFVTGFLGWGLIYLSTPLLFELGSSGIRIAALRAPLQSAQLQGRFEAWNTILAEGDFIGQGIGTTGSVGGRFSSANSLAASDNLYLKVLYEMGIIGAAVFIFLILYALKMSWGFYFDAPDDISRYLALGVLGLLVAVLVNGIVAPSLEYSVAAIIFWFWLGALRGHSLRLKLPGKGDQSAQV